MVKVAVLMGSKSDLPVMQACFDVLKGFGVAYAPAILSAHRTPDLVRQFIHKQEADGCKVFIAAAGMAAHLAGAVAAQTTKPVIGVPLAGGINDGLDALLSTVQMPAGIPVATVAVGKAGAKNSAFLATQILAASDSNLAEKIKNYRSQAATLLQQQTEALCAE